MPLIINLHTEPNNVHFIQFFFFIKATQNLSTFLKSYLKKRKILGKKRSSKTIKV